MDHANHRRVPAAGRLLLAAGLAAALGAGFAAPSSAPPSSAQASSAQASSAQASAAQASSAPALAAAAGHGSQDDEPQLDAEDALAAAFAQSGVITDREAGLVSFPVRVEVRQDSLEYLLVNGHGAVHESLFVTDVDAEVLSLAFLAAGAEPGTNVSYEAIDPPPTREQVMEGAQTHSVDVPRGKPVYLHAAWREAAGPRDQETGSFPTETVHFHRLEDLVIDLNRDRTMRRHGLVWLGSRMIEGEREGDPERFAAKTTGNLLCVSFFSQGDTLMTTALPECVSQTAWIPNGWLMPQPGSAAMIIASPSPLECVPDSLRDALPLVPEPDAGQGGRRR